MKTKIFSKSIMDGDCGGGGISGYTIKRPTALEKLYQASQVLSIDHKNKLHVLKDRFSGEPGPIDIEKAIEIMANMLTHKVFDGSMDMFQETMKMKLVECMLDIVSGKNIIPKGDIDDANTIQRESGGDGSGRNTLLQGFVSLCR